MHFEYLIKKYFSGNLPAEDFPQTAIGGLQEGYDTPSLIALAGLGKVDDSFEKEKYLKNVLKELGIATPSKREACLAYALAIADEIIAGRKDVIAGAGEMYHQAISNYDFYSENKKYVYDSIGFEKIYGLYNEYDDLEQEWVAGDRIKEEIASEIGELLIKELISWKEVIEKR